MSEDALEETNLTAAILDTVGALVVVLDPEGRILRFNKACETCTGYSAAEAGGQRVWDFLLVPEEVERTRGVFNDLKAGHFPNTATNSWLTKDGRPRSIVWSNTAVTGADGAVRQVIGTGIDVTDFEAAEAMAEERHRRLQAILDTAVDGMVTINEAGVIEELNPAAERMFGYAAAELIGQNVKLLMPEPDRSAHDGYLRQHLKTGERKIIGIGREVLGRRKNGSTFPLHLSVSDPAPGGQRLFTGILHDLSQRKQMEALTTRLGRIIEETLNEIYVFDAETLRFVQVNRGARENLGYDLEHLLKLTPVDLKPEFTHAAFEGLLKPLRDGTKPQIEFETLHRRRDGSTYHVAVRLQFMAAETPPVFVAIIEDVTEKKHREEERQRAQRLEAIGQLTGGVAHDFNNLLTVITGNLEMLEPHVAGENDRVMIEHAMEAAELGGQLTQRLLAFARRQPLDARVIDVNELVLGMSELLRRTIGENVQVGTVLGNRLWRTLADPGQVETALLNLALNARDAMPAGGNLTIETANRELDEDYVETYADLAPGRYVMLSVTDSGTGMPPEVRERVFEPFFTTKESGSGTGLGLSLVYGFSKQSGGHLSIYSEEGLGTTVNLYLPAAQADDAAAEAGGERQVEGSVHGETVLVVEDNLRVRRTSVLRLQDLGYTVVEAESAEAALDILRDGTAVDLLFTDVVMPGGMNGSQLAAAARELRPGLRVLFTTGYADTEALPDGLGDHDNIVLRKPYTKPELARMVRAVLEAD